MQINWKDYARELAAEMQDQSSNKLKGQTHLGLSATRTSCLKNEGKYATQEWCVNCFLERMIRTEHELQFREEIFTTQNL